MLAISGIEAGYGESMVVRDVGLTVPPGRVVCLMGRNGVGKTTLLKAIMGIVRARRGSVRWNGTELLGRPPSLRARCGIAYVPQGRDIFPQLTVEENVLLGLEADPKKAKAGVVPKAVYERFPVLYDMRGRRGGDLSGGQQQQLAFARALVSEPKTLLLDEPTEGIQPNIVQDISKLIKELKAEGLAILLVEQGLDFARQTADEYAVMDKGTIAAQGEIASLTEGIIKRHLTV